MAGEQTLLRTASRIDELARPRASIGVVAIVVLAAEVVAAVTAGSVSVLDRTTAGPLMTTIAVVAAAITAITLLARSRGTREPGDSWLTAGWIVIAGLAGVAIRDLPLGVTTNPAGPGVDRALVVVLVWTLVLAVAVMGADLRPEARRLPWVVLVALGALGLAGASVVPRGTLLSRSGPTFGYGLLGGMVVIVAVGASAWWIHRWNARGGWALTWAGVGLVLVTVGTMFQLSASFGSDRAWAASTAMLLSSLVVPSIGAGVAGLGLAGAHSIARRQLVQGLEAEDAADGGAEGDADGTTSGSAEIPLLESLDVQLETVVNVSTGEASGAIATARLPGTELDVDWWRAQAASMQLGDRFELALTTRALDVARREHADAWLVMPVSASAMSPEVMDVLSGPRAGQLVAVVAGSGKALTAVVSDLQARGVNTGINVRRIDPRVIEAVKAGGPSLLVVSGHAVANVATDETSHATVADVVAFAHDNSLAVLATGVRDVVGLTVLRELGVRYASGPGVRATAVAADVAGVAPSAMALIEAAGLRGQAGPDRT